MRPFSVDDKVHTGDRSRKGGGEELLKCAFEVDTCSAPPAEQFDLFRSWHLDVAEPKLLQRSQSFPAHEMVWDLGSLAVISLELPGNGCRYSWRYLKRPTIDSWYLSLSLSRPRDPGGKVEAGKLDLQCLAQPHEYETEDDAFIALIFPRNLSFTRSSKIEIREESRGFLSDYMLLLHRSLPDLRVADVPHIAAATTSLLAACLSPSRDHFVEAQRAIDAVKMERASRIIVEKLSDQNLTPGMLCRELGMSRSQLYRIFGPMGGVSNYIRQKRLLKTRDVLADSSDGRSISAIAEEWGFMDPSAYSRMFRREFGITPKEARVEGWRGALSLRPNGQSADKARALRATLLGNSLGLSDV